MLLSKFDGESKRANTQYTANANRRDGAQGTKSYVRNQELNERALKSCLIRATAWPPQSQSPSLSRNRGPGGQAVPLRCRVYLCLPPPLTRVCGGTA